LLRACIWNLSVVEPRPSVVAMAIRTLQTLRENLRA
jgi:hypothetical protein